MSEAGSVLRRSVLLQLMDRHIRIFFLPHLSFHFTPSFPFGRSLLGHLYLLLRFSLSPSHKQPSSPLASPFSFQFFFLSLLPARDFRPFHQYLSHNKGCLNFITVKQLASRHTLQTTSQPPPPTTKEAPYLPHCWTKALTHVIFRILRGLQNDEPRATPAPEPSPHLHAPRIPPFDSVLRALAVPHNVVAWVVRTLQREIFFISKNGSPPWMFGANLGEPHPTRPVRLVALRDLARTDWDERQAPMKTAMEGGETDLHSQLPPRMAS